MLPNFSLENPDTFSAVFPWTQVEESKPDKCGNRQSCKLLQEKVNKAALSFLSDIFNKTEDYKNSNECKLSC